MPLLLAESSRSRGSSVHWSASSSACESRFITPMTLQARYAAVAKGITGQFYLAILAARLVGLQMSRSAGEHTENQGHTFDRKESGEEW